MGRGGVGCSQEKASLSLSGVPGMPVASAGLFLLAPFQNDDEPPVPSGSPALSVAELFDGMVQRA